MVSSQPLTDSYSILVGLSGLPLQMPDLMQWSAYFDLPLLSIQRGSRWIVPATWAETTHRYNI